jgi:hypothetical protein
MPRLTRYFLRPISTKEALMMSRPYCVVQLTDQGIWESRHIDPTMLAEMAQSPTHRLVEVAMKAQGQTGPLVQFYALVYVPKDHGIPFGEVGTPTETYTRSDEFMLDPDGYERATWAMQPTSVAALPLESALHLSPVHIAKARIGDYRCFIGESQDIPGRYYIATRYRGDTNQHSYLLHAPHATMQDVQNWLRPLHPPILGWEPVGGDHA